MGNAATQAREYPMTERDQELSRHESELANDEAALASEITRMMAAATEFDRKVKSVRAALAEAAIAGHQDPSLAKRVNGIALPPLETETVLARARKERAAAVAARAQANHQVREAVSEWKQQLSALNAQIVNDEQAAQGLVSKMKKARASLEEVETGELLIEPKAPAVPPALKRVQPKTQLMPAVPVPPPPLKAAGADVKRGSQRVQMQAAVDMTSDDNFFSGFSANISDGGLFIATVDYMPKGTQVDLSFSLPTGERIKALGVVRWIREVNDKDPSSFPGLGIQFADLDETGQQAIRAFIEQRDPLFYVD